MSRNQSSSSSSSSSSSQQQSDHTTEMIEFEQRIIQLTRSPHQKSNNGKSSLDQEGECESELIQYISQHLFNHASSQNKKLYMRQRCEMISDMIMQYDQHQQQQRQQNRSGGGNNNNNQTIDFTKSLLKSFDALLEHYHQQQNSNLSSSSNSNNNNVNSNSLMASEILFMEKQYRQTLVQSLIRYVYHNTHNHNNNTLQQYIIFLLDELDSLSESHVIRVTNTILDLLHDRESVSGNGGNSGGGSDDSAPTSSSCEILDLLPKCLSIVYSCTGSYEQLISDDMGGDADADADEQMLNGSDENVHSHFIEQLCTSVRWNSMRTIKIASIIKEMTLREHEFDMIVSKIFEQISKIHFSELPSLIYQLLLLSSKGKRKEIITGIIQHLNQMDLRLQQSHSAASTDANGRNSHNNSNNTSTTTTNSIDQLRSAESVILQFIEFAVKQDHSLAKEVIKMMKDDSSLLYSTFSISFMFVVASVPAFATEVFKLLKLRIDVAYKDSLICRYFFDRETNEFENMNRDISLLIIETIQRSDRGREHILKSICDFGFFLLDSKRVTRQKWTFSLQNSSVEDCHQMGMNILVKLFEIASAARDQIIDTAFNHIVTNLGNVNKYTELIYLLVRSRTGQLSDHTNRFKETVDYFSYFDPVVASSFFEAVGPLVKANREFQDSVMLVLRKALHSREKDSRLIALKGYLHILEAGTSSSVGSSSSSSSSASSNQLDSDILSMLRRCLTQQHAVRSALYEGLVKVATSRPELRDDIAKIFVFHLREYINDKEGAHLEKCVDKGANLKEPLPLLLLYSFRLYQLYGQEETVGTKLLFDFYSEILGTIHEQEAEAHDLSPTSDYSLDSDAGQHKRLIGELFIGLNEVIIEIIVAGDIVEDDGKTAALQTCIHRINKMKELMKKGANKKDGKKAAAAPKGKAKPKVATKSKEFNILLSLKVTNNILRMIMKTNWTDSEVEVDEEYINMLQSYVFSLCKQQLEEISTLGSKRVSSIVSQGKELDAMGKSLMTYITKFAEVNNARNNDEKKKGKSKSHTTNAMDCFIDIVRIKNMFGTERCFGFIEASLVGKKSRYSARSSQSIDSLVESVTRNICQKVDELVKFNAMDEATPLVNLCTEIVRASSANAAQSLLSWSELMCHQHTSSRIEFVKAVVQMYLCVCGKINKFENMKQISNDIMGEMGEFVTRANAHRLIHGIVDENTANSVALVLMESMTEFVSYLNWKLGKMKELNVEYSKLLKSSASGDDNNEEKCEFYYETISAMESKLCTVLCALCTIVNYPCQTRLEISCFEKVNTVCVQLIRLLHDCSQFVLTKRKTTASSSRLHVTEQFIAMTDAAASTVNNIYHLVKYLDNASADNQAVLERAKKGIPELFYRITEYTQVLSELSKGCGQNLLANFKRAPARQFKYRGEILSDNEEEQEEDDENVSSRKRKRGSSTSSSKKRKQKKGRRDGDDEEEREEEDEQVEEEDDNQEENEDNESTHVHKKKKQKR